MVGTFILTWFLVSLAVGKAEFDSFMLLADSIFGKIVLFGLTFALMQHMASGVRHLFMDTGALYDLQVNKNTALMTYGFSIIATVAVWVAAYAVMQAG